MKKFMDLVNERASVVEEIFPWDLAVWLEQGKQALMIDVREPYEYAAMHIEGSINVPRGVLETACEYDYDETVPELAAARDKDVVVICRSGHRSVLAAYNMQLLGFQHTYSLKTGVRGWNEYDQPLIDKYGQTVDVDDADDFFTTKLRPEQESPKI